MRSGRAGVLSRSRLSKATAALSALLLAILVGQVAYRLDWVPARPRSAVVLREIGDTIPSVRVRQLDPTGSTQGETVLLSSAVQSGCHVLFFYDPDCAACKLSAPTWAPNAVPAPPSIRMTWVSVTGNASASFEYLASHGITKPLVVTEKPYPTTLGIAGVPTIWLVTAGVLTQILEGAQATSARNFDGQWCPA